jgi:hypothetical protein
MVMSDGRPRRWARICMSALLVTGAAVAGGAELSNASAAAAAVTGPTLTFSNSATQSSLGTAYSLALTNLLDTNTVTEPASYDQNGLMSSNPDFIQAGTAYGQPWTRDASVNSWNAASLLEPQVAENTLWAVVTRQSNGQLIIQQDNETWDQVVWMTAAWNQYELTGDQTFLANAYQAATDTLSVHESANYNSTYGLFEGPAFFNDGVAGYPAPPVDTAEDQGSYVGSYSATSSMMTLSTNALYYSAFQTTALMAAALGEPASQVAALNAQAAALKTAINKYLWNPATGMYGYFIHGNDSLQGTLDQTEEGTGLSLAILFGIASRAQAQSIMQNTNLQPYGIVDTYPTFPRYSAAEPGRQNDIVWPMVEGYWADAAAQSGDQNTFANEVQNLAGLADASGGFYEVYNSQSGVPDGGWQNGGHWGAVANQTWSATAYLRMIYDDLFGMKFTTSGISFQPTLPSGWGNATLSGVQYRGATLNITVQGAGNVISAFTVDGAASATDSIPASLTGSHTIDITLTGGASSAVTAGVSSSLCLDDHAGSTTDVNPIDIWGCNGTSAQAWTVVKANNTLHVLGKCLDIDGAGTADGTTVDLYDCTGGGNQVWEPQPDGALLNPASGKCLDDPGLSTTPGTQLDIWDCNGGSNQRWTLPTSTAITSGLSSSLCVDNANGNTADGNPIEIWGCNGGLNQQWTVDTATSTVDQLGKCLDITGGGAADGTLVQFYTCNGTGAQTWKPQPDGALLNPASGKCLDDPGSSTTNCTRLEIWDCNGGANQNWTLPQAV